MCSCIISAGCIITDMPQTPVSKIEIIVGDTTKAIAVLGEREIQHICENLRSLELVKMEYTKPTICDYTLKFYGAEGKLIESLDISAEGWISYDGYFHYVRGGEFDREFISELVDIALSSEPKVP